MLISIYVRVLKASVNVYQFQMLIGEKPLFKLINYNAGVRLSLFQVLTYLYFLNLYLRSLAVLSQTLDLVKDAPVLLDKLQRGMCRVQVTLKIMLTVGNQYSTVFKSLCTYFRLDADKRCQESLTRLCLAGGSSSYRATLAAFVYLQCRASRGVGLSVYPVRLSRKRDAVKRLVRCPVRCPVSGKRSRVWLDVP